VKPFTVKKLMYANKNILKINKGTKVGKEKV
jgi:hypothetical protein